MHDEHGWLLTERTVWIALAIYAAVVLAYAAWRSRRSGAQDRIRESGPIL